MLARGDAPVHAPAEHQNATVLANVRSQASGQERCEIFIFDTADHLFAGLAYSREDFDKMERTKVIDVLDRVV